MRIGIFQVAPEHPTLTPKYGLDADNFKDLFLNQDSSLEFHTYMILDGDKPTAIDECDAYLVTGSPHGVYEDHDYISEVSCFARDTAKTKPIIGVCFGHQLLGQAFGGKVEKSKKGWGVGIERYQMKRRPDWLTGNVDGLQTIAMHQDQVIKPPRNSQTIAGNNFCPHGMLQIGENVLTLQTHPEMKEGMARDLICDRIVRIGEETAARALKSLDQINQRDLIAATFLDFIKSRN